MFQADGDMVFLGYLSDSLDKNVSALDFILVSNNRVRQEIDIIMNPIIKETQVLRHTLEDIKIEMKSMSQKDLRLRLTELEKRREELSKKSKEAIRQSRYINYCIYDEDVDLIGIDTILKLKSVIIEDVLNSLTVLAKDQHNLVIGYQKDGDKYSLIRDNIKFDIDLFTGNLALIINVITTPPEEIIELFK